MALKHYNNWSSTLSAALSADPYDALLHIPTDAADKLDFGDGESTFHECYLTLIDTDESGAEIDWEIVKASERTDSGGNAVLTVDRGVDDTTARIWPAGTRIECRLVAVVLNEIATALDL
jgi:hypothetical protein